MCIFEVFQLTYLVSSVFVMQATFAVFTPKESKGENVLQTCPASDDTYFP